MDDQHVLALVEAIHGADFYTIHQLTFDATLIDYIGHLSFLPDGQVSQWPRAFANSGQGRREYLVSALPEEPCNSPPAPCAMPRAMNENKRGHAFLPTNNVVTVEEVVCQNN